MSDTHALALAYQTFRTGTLWKSYAAANPGEAAALDAYVSAVVAGVPPTSPPVLVTPTGQGLAGIVQSGFPYVPPSPPPVAVWMWDALTASVDGNSTSLIQAFQSYAVAKGTYFEACVAWQIAATGTPFYSIPITGQAVKSISAPVPLGTQPGNTFDHSLTVHEAATGIDYDFGLAKYDSATRKISSTDGAAFVPAGAAYETGPDSGNAAAFPLRSGIITPADVKSGKIDHPLHLTIPNCGKGPNPYPSRPGTSGYPNGTGLNLGTWVRLDPAVNVATLGLPQLETMIALAFQKRGAFIRDIGSTLCVVASDQVNQGGNAVDWPAVGVPLPIKNGTVPYAQGLSSKFPWSRLQVLMPPAH